jgi:hypothetical protein
MVAGTGMNPDLLRDSLFVLETRTPLPARCLHHNPLLDQALNRLDWLKWQGKGNSRAQREGHREMARLAKSCRKILDEIQNPPA